MLALRAVLRFFTMALIVFALAVSPILVYSAPTPEKASIMQVKQGSLHLNVTDEAGRPVPGANVTIAGNATYWNHTGADGGLWILNMSVDNYTINASMAGYLNGTSKAVITNNNITNLTVVVEGGKFAGVVYALDNSPIDNATVEVAVGSAILSTLSLPDGSFNLTGIPSGTYIAVIFSPLYSVVSDVITVTAGETTVRPLPFRLNSNTGWIAGYVFDGTIPVPGVSISIPMGTVVHTVLSGDVGNYEIPNVPAGNYSVLASKEGYIDAELDGVVVVNGAGTEDVNISLVGKPATISGSVAAKLSSGSVLLYGALVEVMGTGRNATTGTDGGYEVTDVPVGTWTIKTSAPGYVDNETLGMVVTRGASVPLNVVLEPKPGQLTGTVRSTGNKTTIQGCTVTIDGPLQRETFTNDQGQYVFAGLTPGNYTLTVVGPSGEQRYSPYIAYNIEVEPEGTTSQDVELKLVKQALGGFIFGLDLPHSFMVLALIITLIIMMLAVYIRLRRFQRLEKESGPEEASGEEKKGIPPIQ